MSDEIKSISKLVRIITEYDDGWFHITETYDPHLPEEIGIYDIKVNGK